MARDFGTPRITLHGDGRGEAEGTRDVQEAIEEGRSYNPPEGPFQEGVGEGERR
jgi:hypothetical protein